MRKILVKIIASVALVAGISTAVSAPATAKPVSGSGTISQHGTVKPTTADWWA